MHYIFFLTDDWLSKVGGWVSILTKSNEHIPGIQWDKCYILSSLYLLRNFSVINEEYLYDCPSKQVWQRVCWCLRTQLALALVASDATIHASVRVGCIVFRGRRQCKFWSSLYKQEDRWELQPLWSTYVQVRIKLIICCLMYAEAVYLGRWDVILVEFIWSHWTGCCQCQSPHPQSLLPLISRTVIYY